MEDQEIYLSIIIVHYSNKTSTVVDNSEEVWDIFRDCKLEKYQVSIVYNLSIENCKIIRRISLSNGLELNYVAAFNNMGFGAGCNLGINSSNLFGSLKNRYYWFLNSDAVPQKDSYVNLKIAMKTRQNQSDIWGTLVCSYNDPSKIQSCGGKFSNLFARCTHILDGKKRDCLNYDIKLYADYPVGASFIVTKSFIDNNGPMPEEAFLYFEELLWLNSSKIFKKIEIIPTIVVLHHGGHSTGFSINKKPSYLRYYLSRNIILLGRKKGLFWFFWFAVLELIKVLYRMPKDTCRNTKNSLIGIFDGLIGNYGFNRKYAPQKNE
jgi:GT2 family glycosyltransferase